MESIQQYIKEQKTLLEQTLREMALIKAPTGHEKKRAEYCVEWLQAQGIEEVLSDECTNVIVPWNIQSGKNNCMFMAHLDTVFSEETELMIKEKKGKWCCPGIGDDTANAAILLLLIKYVHEKVKKRSCGVGCVFHLGLLGYFKYSNFFLENLNTVFHTDFPMLQILLPVGISFYTFQQLAYLIDRCRGDGPRDSFFDYLTFMVYFPQLLQGPILLRSEFMGQLMRILRR